MCKMVSRIVEKLLEGGEMKIIALECPKCKDVIFSRATHDFRRCSCEEISIDGGFDYMRIGYKTKSPKTVIIDVKSTKTKLYQDWNLRRDKFGIVKGKEK